ncbi:MAG: glucose-6-phosphate dehydrogenase [Microthrixaceae bacterium]|nr:glucose-6-phosphate dehydrogenase [Microthrixaceae bacterium]
MTPGPAVGGAAGSTGGPARVPRNHVVVLFGATGDLAARKLIPGFFHLCEVGLMPSDFRIIGCSRSDCTDDDFVGVAADAITRFGSSDPTGEAWEAFSSRLGFVPADDYGDLAAAVSQARSGIGDDAAVLHYLSVPPLAMPGIIGELDSSGLAGAASKVILEKPFGTDLASATELDALLHSVFNEDQIFRIDHFLGKEDVQNILAVRFSNRLFEPIWCAEHVRNIQIDVPETLGIENRAGFYDATGAFRDMVVTHLFQTLGFVAMEPPSRFTSDSLHREKQRVFDALAPLDPSRVVRGQYEGYLDADGVAEGSTTETLVALEARIDNERWDGVPIYLRTGKRMPLDKRAVILKLKHPPMGMFDDQDTHGNELVFEIGEPGSIRINFTSKEPGASLELGSAHMDFDYRSSFDPRCELEAYERLLHDAMLDDHMLFNRSEGIERLWEVSAPLLDSPPEVESYPVGSWGPAAVDGLLSPYHWRLPHQSG